MLLITIGILMLAFALTLIALIVAGGVLRDRDKEIMRLNGEIDKLSSFVTRCVRHIEDMDPNSSQNESGSWLN